VVSVQAQRARPQLLRHPGISVALGDPVVDPAREERRKENETFRRADEAKRLIDPRTRNRRQMCKSNPHQHHSAHRIQF
jgi:hypothetical protein